MDVVTVVDRVRRLFALAESDNVHESASASAKAYLLMQKFSLSRAEFDGPTRSGIVLHRCRRWNVHIPEWICQLHALISDSLGGVSLIHAETGVLAFVGDDPHECERQFDRLQADIAASTRRWRQLRTATANPPTHEERDSYSLGIVATLGRQWQILQQRHAKAGRDGKHRDMNMLDRKRSAARSFLAPYNLCRAAASQRMLQAGAFEQGVLDGWRIDLHTTTAPIVLTAEPATLRTTVRHNAHRRYFPSRMIQKSR